MCKRGKREHVNCQLNCWLDDNETAFLVWQETVHYTNLNELGCATINRKQRAVYTPLCAKHKRVQTGDLYRIEQGHTSYLQTGVFSLNLNQSYRNHTHLELLQLFGAQQPFLAYWHLLRHREFAQRLPRLDTLHHLEPYRF